jgi:hypothetical protein
MDESYLAMAREAALLCSSIQVQLTELAAMEAAGATEVEFKVEVGPSDMASFQSTGSSGMAPSPGTPGTSTAATITPARARATRATKTLTPVRPDFEGNYEDFGTVTDDEDITLDGTNVEQMLERSVKPSTGRSIHIFGTSGSLFQFFMSCPRCHRR